MKRISISCVLALGLLGTTFASPAALPQESTEPTRDLTFTARDPDVTDRQTQNGTAPSTTAASTIPDTTAAPTLTEIAAFTVPGGGRYTATAIDGTVRIAGRTLTIGGPDYLIGGVRVSAAEDGLVYGGSTAAYATVTGSSTVEVVSTTTDEEGSTQVVSSSATVAVTSGASEASETAGETGSNNESAMASSGSASESAAEATGAAAVIKPQGAVAALGGIAGLLCVFR